MHRLLLTEADPAVLQMLEEKLSSTYDVHTCCRGAEVLEEYLAFQPELVVLDTTMPGCEAAELLQAAQSRGGKVLAIACGFASPDLLKWAGCVVVKPYDPDVIGRRLIQLRQLLDDRQQLYGRLSNALQELGLERNKAAFWYTETAVQYVRERPGCLIADELYPFVAKSCHASAAAVNKAIHRCIQKAWDKHDPAIWNHYLKNCRECPSNAAFIKAMVKAVE